MLHLPILRAGAPYRSLMVERLTDARSGEPVAEVSHALPGQIARDLRRAAENRRILAERSTKELLEICRRAAALFGEAELPLGEATQTPADYVRQLAATAGIPESLGRRNLKRIVAVLNEMKAVLGGLTRGLDPAILDAGWGIQGRQLSYRCQSDALGAILPNNSPGVHNLWLPAIPLKVPLVLKPGSAEPWTPYRLAQALIAAGCPPEAFSIYPTHHGGAVEILLRTGRSLVFGDTATVRNWSDRSGVQIHGPGYSKVVLGSNAAAAWRDHLKLVVDSIAANSGRSCINASGVWVPAHGRELAAALAERLAAIEARALDDAKAELAAVPDPEVARRISALIDQQLAIPGAEEVTARLRGGGRLVTAHGSTFLLPTVIYCEDPQHPLAHAEFTFPFAAVVEVGADEVFDAIGPTLVATVVSDDCEFRQRALGCRSIERLNLGPIPTHRIAWNQPHEGNLFDHLYQQRAFAMAS